MINKYINDFNKESPLNEYPRPQLVRDSYINLNGCWDFTISNSDVIPSTFDKTIVVPYCVESKLSLINERVKPDSFMFYRKTFIYDRSLHNDKLILHIDACDQHSTIYINQKEVIENDNGYLPIEVDIKPFIKKGENEIIIRVKDDLSHDYPYGKQCNNNGGIWYTPVSGIWQSVWLEAVSDDYISSLTITPDIDNKKVKIIVSSLADELSIKINANNKCIYKQSSKNKIFDVEIDDMILWSPENPFLYDVIIKSKHDEVKSYFAMRKFSCNEKHFLLNNKPYFIHGLLDQGYFLDGIYTPITYKEYEDDILTMKKLGFNCLRKHIKIEPMMYYHYCDKYGMIIFQDMVNNGNYSFFIDTALPNIGLKKFVMHFKNSSNKQKEIFKKSLIDSINYLYNVPCICAYTIFNEGWGQHESDYYYHLLKEIDPSRVIDSTSGWFKENDSDVESLHIYFKKIKINNIVSSRPIFLSEFGGYSLKIENHTYNDKEYGYGKYNDIKSFNDALYKLYVNEIVANIKNGLAGCIYTQVSDIEDEINGLLTYDRKICKVDKEKMLDIKNKIDEEFYYD